MREFAYDDVTIRYEVSGSGFPLLLLAPGGLDSVIEAWGRAAINPLTAYAEDFALIAMDQRNAGGSRGPFDVGDPWGSYLRDQLALADHVGAERFLVMGCCIGCSYALGLVQAAPERVVAAVLEQPIGLTEATYPGWVERRGAWAANLLAHREDLDADAAEAFSREMWDRDFVGAVDRDFVRTVTTPLLVLPGTDLVHPRETALEIADLAPGAKLVDPWKDPPEALEAATEAVRAFLSENAGR